MFKNILVPLDGSEFAERALFPASKIAKSMQAKLILLRVVPQYALLAADPTMYEEMNRLGEEEALSYLRSIADEMELADHIQVIGKSGQPADVIVHYAETHEIDLIMMSSHGRSGISRLVYGSVAEHVMRHANCNTAIINARRASLDRELTKILIPLDGSILAEQGLTPGRELVQALGAELHLLRVITPVHKVLETDAMKTVFDDVERKEIDEAKTYLQLKASEIENVSAINEVEIEENSVADTISNYAVKHEIDMIVMSSHGRTGLKRWVFGSVAEQVLRNACCTTMIVRGSTG